MLRKQATRPGPTGPAPHGMRQKMRGSIGAAGAAALLGGTAAILPAVPAWASPPAPVTGTFAVTSVTPTSTRTAGGNTFVTATRTAALAGTFTGATTDTVTLVFHSDGTTSVRGTGTCACTVDGRSGTLSYQFVAAGTFPASASGQYVAQGSGGLAGLHAQGPFSGSFLVVSLGGQLHFS